jgi:hypothetical protein
MANRNLWRVAEAGIGGLVAAGLLGAFGAVTLNEALLLWLGLSGFLYLEIPK